MLKNPVMFVVEVGAAFLTFRMLAVMFLPTTVSGFELQITLWLWFTVLFANFAEAMAEGRGKAQADTLRKSRTETTATLIEADGSHRSIAAPAPEKRRRCLCRCRRIYSRRRRGGGGCGIGRRIGYNGRIGSGHSRIGRRPFGCDRRHQGAFGLDQGPHHVESGRNFHRQNDRARRRGFAAENPERDCVEYFACGLDHRVPARRRYAAAFCDLFFGTANDLCFDLASWFA